MEELLEVVTVPTTPPEPQVFTVGQPFIVTLPVQINEEQLATQLRMLYDSPVEKNGETLRLTSHIPDWFGTFQDKVISAVDDPYTWQTKRGNLPKRVAKAIKELYQIRMPNDLMGKFGEALQRTTSGMGETYYGDTTTTLDWDSGDFGDEGSCFWWRGHTGDCRWNAKYLVEEHGFAVRLYYDKDRNEGLARCWCFPQDGVYYLFNAYGKRVETFANILLALLPGYQMTKVELRNNECEHGLLYINSGMGYAIHKGRYAQERHDFEIDEDPYRLMDGGEDQRPTCYACDEHFDEDDLYEGPNGHMYCESCFDDRFYTCDRCGSAVRQDDAIYIEEGSHRYCSSSCANAKGWYECDGCGEWHQDTHSVGYDNLCDDCYQADIVECDKCGCEVTLNSDIRELDDACEFHGHTYCPDCLLEIQQGYCPRCATSGKINCEDEPLYIEGVEVCADCCHAYHQEQDGLSQGALT